MRIKSGHPPLTLEKNRLQVKLQTGKIFGYSFMDSAAIRIAENPSKDITIGNDGTGIFTYMYLHLP